MYLYLYIFGEGDVQEKYFNSSPNKLRQCNTSFQVHFLEIIAAVIVMLSVWLTFFACNLSICWGFSGYGELFIGSSME